MTLSRRSTVTLGLLASSLAFVGCSHRMQHHGPMMEDYKPVAMLVEDKDGQLQVLDPNGKPVPAMASAERVTTVPAGADPKSFDVYKVTPLDNKKQGAAAEEPRTALQKTAFIKAQATTPCTSWIYSGGRKYGLPPGCYP